MGLDSTFDVSDLCSKNVNAGKKNTYAEAEKINKVRQKSYVHGV